MTTRMPPIVYRMLRLGTKYPMTSKTIPRTIMTTPFQYSDFRYRLISRKSASVPVASAAHWATNGTEHPQHGTDNQQNNTDRLQHSHFQHVSEYQQDDAQADHDASIPITWSTSIAGIELGCGR